MIKFKNLKVKYSIQKGSLFLFFLLLKPAFKDYIWGGEKLRTDFNKKCDFDRVAESWELSCHKDGNSVIINGEFKGKTLEEYIKCSLEADWAIPEAPFEDELLATGLGEVMLFTVRLGEQ